MRWMISGFLCALVVLATVAPPVSPVSGRVVDSFRPPSCERCAGHRGITIATEQGSQAVAVRPGLVTFSGEVAGLIYVVQEIRPGVRVTYGWLADKAVSAGQILGAGELLGHTGTRTYLGVRSGDNYVDPLSHLGFARARLVGHQYVIGGRSAHFR